MKTLGIIGGMSWESTSLYYSALNKGVASRLGGLHSAKLILASVDFHEIVELQRAGRWDEAGVLLADIATRLVAAGAEGLALAVNTMHLVAPQITASIKIPFLDIRDAIANDLRTRNISTAGLLGTGYVMEEGFYRRHIEAGANCEVLIPSGSGVTDMNEIIYGELSKGMVAERSRKKVIEMIGEFQRRGAQSVILGCTELPMLELEHDSPLPLLDSMALHVNTCLDLMLEHTALPRTTDA